VYVSSEAENGSLGGRDEGDGDVEVEVDSWSGIIEVACGSLRSRITWVIVGWKMPPYLECAMRCMGKVLP
jgi:hypothetical protein